MAAYSTGAMREVAEKGVDNLACVLAGAWPPEENIVNAGVVSHYLAASL
jgi:hypothetical protein